MSRKGANRRRKNVLAANSSNLHKAELGKASKWAELPAPPAAKDFSSSTSRATRKVKALMEIMTSGKTSQKQDSAHSNASQMQNMPLSTANDGPAEPEKDDGCATETAALKTSGSALVNVFQKSKSKAREKKKQHLKEKRKGKKSKPKQEQYFKVDDVPKSEIPADHVKFGEVVHAPPKVNLKRRHWDGQSGLNGRSRHAAMLRKHLEAGEARMAEKNNPSQRDLEVRQAIIGAYRTAKKARSACGTMANMATLKALVASGQHAE